MKCPACSGPVNSEVRLKVDKELLKMKGCTFMRFFVLFMLMKVSVMAVDTSVDTSLAVKDTDALLEGIARVENPNFDVNRVGDKHLTYKAYGIFQIRQPYLSNVNKIAGVEGVKAVWGKSSLSIDDVKNPKIAVWCVKVYLSHYGKHYEKTTGKKPTEEVYARMHNGGPDGWKKSVTAKYWTKVSVKINEYYAAMIVASAVSKA